jgi:hypothetical protein
MAAKMWRRKDGSLIRPPEPETYMISITCDQSRALKALAEAEGVKAYELAQRAVVEFIRSGPTRQRPSEKARMRENAHTLLDFRVPTLSIECEGDPCAEILTT